MEGQRTYGLTVLSWLLVLAWAVFIFFMSSNTGDALGDGDGLVSLIFQWLHGIQAGVLPSDVDVVSPAAHFCEYAIFGALWMNAWRTRVATPWAVWAAVVCASLYGISDEIHQIFVPGRTADPVDWLVDTCGAALGAFVAYAVICHLRKRRLATARDEAMQGEAAIDAETSGEEGCGL
ncbi:MAG: VanZ family protein [Eggerthellaceae bacterium]|nr:VanZ family protein [Eggerthellaceae bacterium]